MYSRSKPEKLIEYSNGTMMNMYSAREKYDSEIEERVKNKLDKNSRIMPLNELSVKSKNYKDMSSSNQILLNSASFNGKQNIESKEYKEDFERQKCSEIDLQENMIKNIQESKEGMLEKWGQVTEVVNQTVNTTVISLENSALVL